MMCVSSSSSSHEVLSQLETLEGPLSPLKARMDALARLIELAPRIHAMEEETGKRIINA